MIIDYIAKERVLLTKRDFGGSCHSYEVEDGEKWCAMLEHFGKPPKIAPRIRVYPSDPNICSFTQTERGLSLKMDSLKTITEIRQKLFVACWSQEGLSETELSLRSMKSNQLKENEQSSVCRAAGGVRGGSPQPSKLACSDISETPQTPMTRYASEIRAIEQGREEKQVSTLNPTIRPERYKFSSKLTILAIM
ncbi:hypothetical protein Bca4012_002086 [Brassica carinata]